MKRTASTRIISFVVLAACGALCQNQSSSAAMFQGALAYSPNMPEAHSSEFHTQRSLLNTSLPPAPPQPRLHAAAENASANVTFVTTAISARFTEKEKLFASGMEFTFSGLYGGTVSQRTPNVSFGAYQYPLVLEYAAFKRNALYHPSPSDSILGRARYAAASVLITRQPSGKKTLNTSHLLSVLTKAAIAAAYRPYWARPRSPSSMFKNAGSDLGGEFGINLFHEFWPGIRKILKLQKILPAN
jgi:hypothetical protein